MAKRHCYSTSTAPSNSGHHDTAFLLDSLYCLEERLEEEIADGHSQQNDEENDSCFYRAIDININSPDSVNLSEQDFLWEDDELVSLFLKERKNKLQNTLQNDPKLAAARTKAVEWILKVNAHYSFTALTAVLAVDYVDRFLSRVHIQIEKPWMIHLATVACLSIAAKVEETHVPLLLDLQVEDSEYYFEAKTIKRMEILVLSSLQWRMNPVNPISFLDYFVRRLGFKYQLCSDFLCRCERLLLSAISDSRFMSFLPSVIASAIMLQVIDEIEPCVAVKDKDQLLGFLQIDKDKVRECSRFILEASRGHKNEDKQRFGSIPSGSSNGWNETWSAASSWEPITKKRKVNERPSLQMLDFTTTAAEFSGIP